MQLQIKPALRQVWRAPGTVQIGLDPRFGMVLDGLTPDDRTLLDRLRSGADAPTSGAARDQALLRLLGEGGVLVETRSQAPPPVRSGGARARLAPDAATWSVVHGPGGGDGWDLLAARAGRCVEVVGGGRTGAAIATTLACAGVGSVRLEDDTLVTDADISPASVPAAAVGTVRRDAVQGAIGRLFRRPPSPGAARRDPAEAPSPGRDPGPGPAADLVVLIEHGAADALAAEYLVGADVPHLSVVVREGTIVVGPLVLPGSSPCLRCLDLHRADRDPAWPRILAQLVAERRGPAGGRLVTEAEETASSLLGASLAALQVLGHLDGLHLATTARGLTGGRPAAVGATLEVELPDGLACRRDWPAHPACGCHWPPPGDGWPAAAQDRDRPATMGQ